MAVLLFGVFGLLLVGSSYAAFVLRSRFPQVWKVEGEPVRWLWLNRMPHSQHFFTFLDERRYLGTGSSSYARLCSAIRIGWYGLMLLFLVLMVAFPVALLFKQ